MKQATPPLTLAVREAVIVVVAQNAVIIIVVTQNEIKKPLQSW